MTPACLESSGIGLKGWPNDLIGQPLSSIRYAGKSLRRDELPLPAAVLRRDVMEANSRWMQAFLAHMEVSIAPHGKTTMSPELIQRQLDDGAWAMTAATAHHARIYAAMGVTRILIANQVVGTANIDTVLNLRSRNVEILLIVDSLANAKVLSDAVSASGQPPLDVLIEIGDAGQRAGVRTAQDALKLAQDCADLPGIAVRGVECFEGVYIPYANAPQSVAAMLTKMIDAAERIDEAGLFSSGNIILSAGGSGFFDQAVRAMHSAKLSSPPHIVIRSGCYLVHDSKLYNEAFESLLKREPELSSFGKLHSAIEVWAHIQSRPEPTRAIAAIGKRDISDDAHRPVPLTLFRVGRDDAPGPVPAGMVVTGLNDHHGFIDLPAEADVQVGDIVAFGCSHPCTTFDKWKVIYVVDADDVVVDIIRTVF